MFRLFFFRLFLVQTFSKFSNVRFFFVAGCLRVPKGCLRGARFARNFFEKSFESLPRMIKSSTRLGVGHFFFRNSGPGGCGLALQMFRVCVFPGASRPKMLQEFFQKFGKIRENAPDPTFIGRARGGLTYFGASMIYLLLVYCFAEGASHNR